MQIDGTVVTAVYVDDVSDASDVDDVVGGGVHDDEAGDLTVDADDVGDNDGRYADICDGCHGFIGHVDQDAGEHDGRGACHDHGGGEGDDDDDVDDTVHDADVYHDGADDDVLGDGDDDVRGDDDADENSDNGCVDNDDGWL